MANIASLCAVDILNIDVSEFNESTISKIIKFRFSSDPDASIVPKLIKKKEKKEKETKDRKEKKEPARHRCSNESPKCRKLEVISGMCIDHYKEEHGEDKKYKAFMKDHPPKAGKSKKDSEEESGEGKKYKI